MVFDNAILYCCKRKSYEGNKNETKKIHFCIHVSYISHTHTHKHAHICAERRVNMSAMIKHETLHLVPDSHTYKNSGNKYSYLSAVAFIIIMDGKTEAWFRLGWGQ